MDQFWFSRTYFHLSFKIKDNLIVLNFCDKILVITWDRI